MRTRTSRALAHILAVVLATLSLSLFPAPAAGADTELPASDLDGGCFSLRVTTTGTTAGSANYIERSDVGYGTRGTAETAEPVAFEATAPGRYRLYDSVGGMLYLSVAGFVWAGTSYGDRADWTITEADTGYRIRSTPTGDLIGSVSGRLTTSDASFALESSSGCTIPPMAGTGMVSAATLPPVNADGTMVGFIDAHAHPVASAAFGGDLICGDPFAPGGIEDALSGCPSHTVGAGALFEAIIGGTDPLAGDDGWPSFDDWPSTSSLLHQQAYYEGIERAWRSGLRVLNTLLVGNRVICELYPTRVTPCDEGEQIRAQAELLTDMEDYVDAQSGGEGMGWFRIARTPEETRSIAASGKLAVTIGVESSELFGCRETAAALCDEATIDAGLDELEGLGVSGLYPVHKFDNAFGGTRFDPGVTGAALNIGNYLSAGHWWTAESCSGPSDNEQVIASDEIAALLAGGSGLPAGTTAPVYPSGPICNTRTLTDLGEHLIDSMMERGMIIHIDHMGVRTAEAVLDRVESVGYTGVAAVHTWSDRSITARVAEAGGFVASYAYSASDAGNGEPDFISEWQANQEATEPGSLVAYGFGSDVNGLAPQPSARLDASTDPIIYPFAAPNGAVFDRQIFGERTWDLNTDGVAHYGLYADWMADILDRAETEAPGLEEQLMRGAEAYTHMWEDSRAWSE